MLPAGTLNQRYFESNSFFNQRYVKVDSVLCAQWAYSVVISILRINMIVIVVGMPNRVAQSLARLTREPQFDTATYYSFPFR